MSGVLSFILHCLLYAFVIFIVFDLFLKFIEGNDIFIDTAYSFYLKIKKLFKFRKKVVNKSQEEFDESSEWEN